MSALTDAFLVLLRDGAAPAPVHDGHVPTDAAGTPLDDRYGVLWSTPATRDHDDLAHTSDRYRARWQVTSVGTTREQAEWVAVRCRDAVVDHRLRPPGWSTTPVEHASSTPIRRDDDLPGQPLYTAVDTYALTATPTTGDPLWP